MVSGADASDLPGQPPDRRRVIVAVHADWVGFNQKKIDTDARGDDVGRGIAGSHRAMP
jgi:hypothetical protein